MTRNVLINVLVTGSLSARISRLDNTPPAKLLNYSYTSSCLSSRRFLPHPPPRISALQTQINATFPQKKPNYTFAKKWNNKNYTRTWNFLKTTIIVHFIRP